MHAFCVLVVVVVVVVVIYSSVILNTEIICHLYILSFVEPQPKVRFLENVSITTGLFLI